MPGFGSAGSGNARATRMPGGVGAGEKIPGHRLIAYSAISTISFIDMFFVSSEPIIIRVSISFVLLSFHRKYVHILNSFNATSLLSSRLLPWVNCIVTYTLSKSSAFVFF